ncbi:polyphosphate kinase 2 [Lacihabitans sp. LS3-19]|uniref:polyphosphate kinase 2 n=1 Tax=Lacihabitans sp. LS3-19 TaxID=2487335 RepID=UPI0020CBF71E|nr:polyphosphate kinase 2 [Lacihabitans sp. LS3-19]
MAKSTSTTKKNSTKPLATKKTEESKNEKSYEAKLLIESPKVLEIESAKPTPVIPKRITSKARQPIVEDLTWKSETITLGELAEMNSKNDLAEYFRQKKADPQRILKSLRYETELEKLQIELVKLQRWVQDSGARVVILFEGRDAAGKGGTIRRFTEHMNPRALRVVALPKPTADEMGQWYFQRYIKQLPNKGEIVFFDRSWYNRAVVEPVNGFCSKSQYERFMQQVTEFEHMLYEDGILIIKFWFSISKEEQLRRFKSRMANPLKQWKLSPVDMEAQEKWNLYTNYKEEMFNKTHTSFSPWIIVKANNKMRARLESIRYVLSKIDYENKSLKTRVLPDPDIVTRYHRRALQVDN